MAFARQYDRKRHEGFHSRNKNLACNGDLRGGGQWGCGRRFARVSALARHFRSETGRVCVKPLLDEEMQAAGQNMAVIHVELGVLRACSTALSEGTYSEAVGGSGRLAEGFLTTAEVSNVLREAEAPL